MDKVRTEVEVSPVVVATLMTPLMAVPEASEVDVDSVEAFRVAPHPSEEIVVTMKNSVTREESSEEL